MNVVEKAILGKDKNQNNQSKKHKLNAGVEPDDYGEYVPGKDKNYLSQSF